MLIAIILRFLTESTADLTAGFQVLMGSVLALLGLFGLWKVRFALLHQASGPVDAWQPIAACIICLVLGLFVAIHAERTKRK